MIPNFSDYWINPGAVREGCCFYNEKRSPADVRLKAALTDE
jgi:hypothetical protein